MDFELIELDEERAAKISSISGKPQEPGFFWFPIKPKEGSSGLKQEEITKIVLWANAHKGYLGVKYHEWPWHKKLMAHLRISYLQRIYYPLKAYKEVEPRNSDHVLIMAMIGAD